MKSFGGANHSGIPPDVLRAIERAHAVFATIPRAALARRQSRHVFYVRDEAAAEGPGMGSFATPPADINAFVAAIRRAL